MLILLYGTFKVRQRYEYKDMRSFKCQNCGLMKLRADVVWDPVRGEGSCLDFCFICKWKGRQQLSPFHSQLVVSIPIHPLKSQRAPSLFWRSFCSHERLALEWTIKWPFLSGVQVNLKCLWRRFQKAFTSLPQQLVKRISGMLGIQHKRVDWTLNFSQKWKRKEIKQHNRILAQPIIPAVSREKGERKRYR